LHAITAFPTVKEVWISLLEKYGFDVAGKPSHHKYRYSVLETGGKSEH
jgi:hypothetical protein